MKATSCCLGFQLPSLSLKEQNQFHEIDGANSMSVEKLARVKAGTAAKSVQDYDRMTVKLSAYHEHYGDPTDGRQFGGSFFLDTVEQVLTRKMQVGNVPVDLYKGHFVGSESNIGCVIIENTTTVKLGFTPTQEEIKQVEEAVVKVCLTGNESDPGITIIPGLFVFIPGCDDLTKVTLKCLSEVKAATINVYLYPR